MTYSKIINYSIIIPHKNIPLLLRRCLDSIPYRKDIQIIIVDDNSDPTFVDFSNFPGLDDSQTEVYFTKESKGAGYARNVGLTKAKGKWLLFADADDFFHDSLNDILEKYKNEKADLIIFKSDSSDSKTLEKIESRGEIYNNWIQSSIDKGVLLDEIRYSINPPWAKIFSHQLIKNNKIYFDEVFTGNDVMFSTKCGHFAKKILLNEEYMYCATYRHNSLDTQNSYKHIKSRFEAELSKYCFLKNVNKEKYSANFFSFLYLSRKVDDNWGKNFFFPTLQHIGVKRVISDFFRSLKMKFF